MQVMEGKTKKRQAEEEIVNTLIAKKRRLDADIAALLKSSESFAEQAEQKGDLTMIAKSNSLRKTAKDKSAEMQEIEKDIAAKNLLLKNL